MQCVAFPFSLLFLSWQRHVPYRLEQLRSACASSSHSTTFGWSFQPTAPALLLRPVMPPSFALHRGGSPSDGPTDSAKDLSMHSAPTESPKSAPHFSLSVEEDVFPPPPPFARRSSPAMGYLFSFLRELSFIIVCV